MKRLQPSLHIFYQYYLFLCNVKLGFELFKMFLLYNTDMFALYHILQVSDVYSQTQQVLIITLYP